MVLECSFEKKRIWERLRGEEEEKLGQGEKIKIVGVIYSHFFLLSDQASWVKKIQEIQGMNLNPRKLYLMSKLEKP